MSASAVAASFVVIGARRVFNSFRSVTTALREAQPNVPPVNEVTSGQAG